MGNTPIPATLSSSNSTAGKPSRNATLADNLEHVLIMPSVLSRSWMLVIYDMNEVFHEVFCPCHGLSCGESWSLVDGWQSYVGQSGLSQNIWQSCHLVMITLSSKSRRFFLLCT